MTENDGGPAFPSEQGTDHNGCWNQTYAQGMSLRDYFAAAALNGMGASDYWSENFTNDTLSVGRDVVAIIAYKMADAMLEARKK